jgi:hypothetical protein
MASAAFGINASVTQKMISKLILEIPFREVISYHQLCLECGVRMTSAHLLFN